jgi:hypothetical protein
MNLGEREEKRRGAHFRDETSTTNDFNVFY